MSFCQLVHLPSRMSLPMISAMRPWSTSWFSLSGFVPWLYSLFSLSHFWLACMLKAPLITKKQVETSISLHLCIGQVLIIILTELENRGSANLNHIPRPFLIFIVFDVAVV